MKRDLSRQLVQVHNEFDFTLAKELLKKNNQIANSFQIKNLAAVSTSLPEQENIYILSHQLAQDFPRHSHDYFEMIYVLKGSLRNQIDQQEIYMDEGDLCLLNTRAFHQLFFDRDDAIIINICLRRPLFSGTLKAFYNAPNYLAGFLREDLSGPQNYIFFPAAQNREYQHLLNRMIAEYKEAGFHQTFALEAYILLLLARLAQHDEYSFYGIDRQALEILTYLKTECLHKTLNEIAADLSYHPSYLSGYIKKHSGRSAKDLIREVKLSRARELLTYSELPVEEIAHQCGYQSSSHFFRIFQEQTGQTPANYRLLQLQKTKRERR